MSRSNTPQIPGTRPLQNGAAEHDAQAWAFQAQRPARPQGYPPAADPNYADPYAQQGVGYHYPQGQQQADPYAQAGVQPNAAPRGYADPQAYAAAAQAAQAAQPSPYGYSGYAAQGAADPTGLSQLRADLRQPSYDQWQTPSGQDYRSYDLGSYAGGNAAQLGARPQDYGQYYGQTGDYGRDGFNGLGDPNSLDPHAYGGQQAHGQALEQTYGHEEEDYEPEQPRRGRSLKILAVLAGAIVMGGGLAYAYSSLLGPTSDGTAPLVKNAGGPVKVKPSDPGGKQFAHTDSKIMGRLGEGGASDGAAPAPAGEASAASSVDPSGARKVPLLVVGRDGTIQAPSASDSGSAPGEQGTKATVAVPGMTVIDGLGGAPESRPPTAPVQMAEAKPVPTPTSEPAKAAAQPVVVRPPAAPKKPEIVAAVVPPTTKAAATDADAAPAAAPAKKAPVKKVAAATGAATGPQPTGAGYVAVLASVPASGKSRMDALKQFADLQQKYGNVLSEKTPDVQEANLGEKGTFHRLVVGPPGSRDSASALCTQLKAQGYNDCWVMAY